MKNIKYPPKPWYNGQREELIKGIDFIYSQSTKKWVPVTPGYTSKRQLKESFDVETIEDLNAKFKTIDDVIQALDSEIDTKGRIWKTLNRPQGPSPNDLWIDPISNRAYSFNETGNTWVELTYIN